MNKVILLLDQAVNRCAYIRRFNVLMLFMNDKKKAEMMLKENAGGFRDNEKMLFESKFEQVVAKSLTLKNKSRELFDNLKEQGISSGNKDSRKQQPFQKAPLFRARRNRRRGIFSQADQSISNAGTEKRGENTVSHTQFQYTRTPVPLNIFSKIGQNQRTTPQS